LSLDDRDQVDAERPDPARSKLDAERRAVLRDPAAAVELEHRTAAIALALVPERHRPRCGLVPALAFPVPAFLRFHDVREVTGVVELEADLLPLRCQVLEDDVLVRAFRDEPVPSDAD